MVKFIMILASRSRFYSSDKKGASDEMEGNATMHLVILFSPKFLVATQHDIMANFLSCAM